MIGTQRQWNKSTRWCDVTIEEMDFGDERGAIPLFCAEAAEAAEPVAWAAAHAAWIDEMLSTRGALLVRGLSIGGSKKLGAVLEQAFDSELLDYDFRSTPRTRMRGNVYTSTEYHPAETIPLHNEHAYSNKWPLRIGFYCDVAAREGGATPIADSRRVYNRVPRDIVDHFERKGIRYVRHYSNIDLPWSEVFQTEERAEVERYCSENGIEFEWGADGLSTRQTSGATMVHPVSGERLWFNQAHLFHVSSLPAEAQADLLRVFGEDRLPRHAYHADGSGIDPSMLHEIRNAYEACKIVFQWRQGDLLLLDNMLFCHGREPFSGDRKVLVGMARACHA